MAPDETRVTILPDPEGGGCTATVEDVFVCGVAGGCGTVVFGTVGVVDGGAPTVALTATFWTFANVVSWNT